MAIKLGELLVKANVINDVQLKAALVEQQKWGGKLGQILVRMSFCSEDIVVKALAKQLGLQRADLENLPPVPPEVVRKIPIEMSRDNDLVPLQLRDDGRTLVVATANPLDLESLDMVRARTGCKIVPLIAGPTALGKVRDRLYYGEGEIEPSADESLRFTNSAGQTLRPGQAPSPAAAPDPARADALSPLEEAQRREIAALKALVEVLIEKGVFTREEYLARVKR